ncbi:MAG TPA: glycogen debranching protein GlgX [Acidiferrobacter sp.]|nr:glycogen debranching protein GlgX [Acidiferrobacter sp.]
MKGEPALWPGHSYPLGAEWDGNGINFALFSGQAERVELCLFDAKGEHETHRLPLPEKSNEVWHGYLPHAKPGLVYGYRVYGPYAPVQGQRCNPHKLLLDPYAKAIAGTLDWSDAHFGYHIGHVKADLSLDKRDNASRMLKAVVVDSHFDWGDDQPPRTPWSNTIIYETHVRGLSMQHPDVLKHLRGTCAGLASAPIVTHLQKLGVTAINLLPIQAFVDDRNLAERGLHHYWGYNSLGFFAPHPPYLSSGKIDEFKEMVKALHKSGIEVILDVVYNHTAEGNELGPTLSFRGIDNAAYYRLVADQPRYYADTTGCGNSLNADHPRVMQLILDSLRYWVEEMHVDGFRFDLAVSLTRPYRSDNRMGPLFEILLQDPVLARVKLIAEPWDLGEDGYKLGAFPPGCAEWNDRYRDTLRAFWKGDDGQLGGLAARLGGSADLYARADRGPNTSINFLTAHDGFTMHDLVSYNEKHNEANQNDNQDGNDNNLSWNCGAEGETDNAEINALRARQERNFIASLLLSQGTPMLLAGDELSHSQQGNNNAYCQDNPLSWLSWDLGAEQQKLLDFTQNLIQLRRDHPSLRRKLFFRGQAMTSSPIKDVTWFHPDGREMGAEDWEQADAHCLGLYLAGTELTDRDAQGQPVKDEDFLLLLNAFQEEVSFALPSLNKEASWKCLLDTAQDEGATKEDQHSGKSYPLQARSLVLLHYGEANQ